MILPLIVFIQLHTIDGNLIEVNPHEVTTLRHTEKGKPGDKLFKPEVECVVGLVDGKYVTVKESCAEVRKLLEDK